MNKQEYAKGGSAGSKGSQFQVHLLCVFLLNALRMKLTNWRLSTEDKRAGKFDDVVLEWLEGAFLLQAKHKENKNRITVEQLMSTTSKYNDFSIAKYFLSYQEIKAEFPSLKKVVICTNASVNERALRFLNSQRDSSDSVMFCERDESLFYTLKDGILCELKDNIKTYYSQKFNGREVDESVISDANLKDFQKYFQIYFNYPSGNDMESIIEQLLDRTSWCAKVSALEIYSKVMDWFQQKDGKFFKELHARAMVSEIRRDKYWQSLRQYDVRFPNNDLDFEDSNRRYHFIADGACLLQEIRIWQGLRGKGKKALCIHTDDSMEDQKQLIKAFELKNYTFLIFIQPNDSVVMELWNQIEEILNKSACKKVVLLTAGVNKLIRRIQSSNNSFDVTKEPPTFEDLLEETRDRLLKSEKILFQGDVINLEELLAPGSLRDYRTYLGSETLERLVGGEQIRVGSKVSVLEEEVERSYIPRKFIRKNEERLEENIFRANDKLILIADSAGMGKTTTLTKLAVLVKENNPHLWVLKIVLHHYSKFLKDSLRKHKTVIDIVEFLDSQETTRLGNQFAKFVFSMDKKVVLMLDGIDEISPNYTGLIESLLVNCMKTSNFIKIFATTRPHLAEKLEEKFQVKSFKLEPFSEKNQTDFLTRYWIHNLGHTEREKCEQYARALLQTISLRNSYFRWENNFFAIPLQVKMAAEIFQESGRNEGAMDWEGCKEFLNSDRLDPNLPTKMDLTGLYKLCIQKKRDLFIEKFNPGGIAGADQALIDQYEETLVFHRTLALEVIIDDEKIQDLFSRYKEGQKICKTNALKMGIIQETDNNFHFIHRTFAEYFVAECLLIELKRHNQNAEFQKFLIDDILGNFKFRIIRTFFDNLLQDCVDSLPHDIFRAYQRLSYDISSFYPYSICLVHNLAESGCVAILRLVLKCVDFKVIKGVETPISCGLLRRYFGNKLKVLQYFVQRGGINIKDAAGRTPLHLATGEGHLEMVKFLVEQGATINTTYDKLYTPLYEAAIYGHLAVVKYLVEQGADIIANVRQSGCELYEAILENHVRIVEYLLDTILETVILKPGLDEEYAMIPFAAAYLGRKDILKVLIDGGMDVNKGIIYKQPLIFGAAMGGQLEVVKYLVDQGADINVRDHYGRTVLRVISSKSSLTCTAKFLIDLGVEIDAKDYCEMTALHIAADAGAYDMAELLIKSGADVNSTEKSRGDSIILRAANKKHWAIVELLAKHGADVNVKNADGDILLNRFTVRQLDVVKCLVKLSVNANAKDEDGCTALHWAVLQFQPDVAKYLIECSNIDVNSRDSNGDTVLHLYVSYRLHGVAPERLDIIQRLVARGANLNLTNNRGETVLHLAILAAVLYCNLPSCDQCLLVIKSLIEQGAGIATKSSKVDVKTTLAKQLQKDERYRGHSLSTILQLPVLKLLDHMPPLTHESDPLSNHSCIVS